MYSLASQWWNGLKMQDQSHFALRRSADDSPSLVRFLRVVCVVGAPQWTAALNVQPWLPISWSCYNWPQQQPTDMLIFCVLHDRIAIVRSLGWLLYSLSEASTDIMFHHHCNSVLLVMLACDMSCLGSHLVEVAGELHALTGHLTTIQVGSDMSLMQNLQV